MENLVILLLKFIQVLFHLQILHRHSDIKSLVKLNFDASKAKVYPSLLFVFSNLLTT